MKSFMPILGFYFLVVSALQANLPLANNRELFEDKNILIIGGTGYLGRAIATEILQYNPRQIALFSRDEVKHFACTKIFSNNPIIKNIIGDIRDYTTLEKATKDRDIVFHVAALKRMDVLENNVEEAIKTNIIGSLNVFNACATNNVPKVLFISTDKACLPINIYGACKFASEKIFTNYDKSAISTKFIVARFGNILESTGSVIPTFVEIIKAGKEIPLTDEQMTRFIITKEGACQLLFDALRYGIGGEIFIKRLSSFKITDLIAVLKDAFRANNPVRVVGLRPGEKIHEVLINTSEIARTIDFNGLYIVQPSISIGLEGHSQHEMPLYRIMGKQLAPNFPQEYSSDQEVISQQEISLFFQEQGIKKDSL
jgi:UDP-N-acetylglucosamine 4,6-dehydratase